MQLPVPEIQPLYNEGNIPLAAGYLRAYAESKAPSGALDIRIIPRDIANFGGDAAILEWILETRAAIVGFTSYMWNVERNIRMAQRLKERIPGIITILGGPEIAGKHWAFAEPAIDAFVVGEGERAFIELLIQFERKLPLQRFFSSQEYLDLSCLPNPYLQEIIVPSTGEPMLLETMRGCPYQCTYCFYSKSYSRMRYFPEDLIGSFFAMARQYRVPEVYVMDPSFNVAPGLEARLDKIAAANTTDIPLHTEIRLESVTPQIARSMKQAGFHSAEVGLQSITPQALEAIHRSFDREAFIAGARNLQQQGIDAKTGVILGLPYDTPQDFAATLEFLIDLNLQESMEIYPLSILPGTTLRDQAGEFGLDRFHNPRQPFIHFIDLRQNLEQTIERLFQKPSRIGHSLTILWNREIDHPALRRLAEWLDEHNPSTLIQLILDRRQIPSMKEIKNLFSIWNRPDAYFDRIHHSNIHPQKRHSVRVFHLAEDLATAEAYLWQPQFCDLILSFSPQLLTHGREILEEKPILLIDSPIPNDQLIQLTHAYAGFDNFLIKIP